MVIGVLYHTIHRKDREERKENQLNLACLACFAVKMFLYSVDVGVKVWGL